MYRLGRIAIRRTSSISVLDSSFIKADQVEPKNINEQYHFSTANAKSLRLISAIQLDTRLASKNIVVAGPHPGSTIMLDNVIKTVAKDISAHVQVLDYQLICRTIYRFERKDTPQLEWNLDPKQLKLSEGFSPGSYEIRDEVEDETDDVEMDDDDLEEDSTVMNYRFPTFPRPKVSKINLNVNVVQNPDKEKIFSISNITLTTPEESVKPIDKDPFTTPYDIKLTDLQISNFLDSLLESITRKYEKKEKFILFLKDFNDIAEGLNDEAGQRIILGLTQLVSRLRTREIPCVLVVGSSPSITDNKNISKDLDFYTQIIDGSIFTETDLKGQKNMAMDGTIFGTPLDFALGQFEKIEMLPPSTVYLSLQKSKPAQNLMKELASNQQKLRQYLLQLETDLEIRIGQVNCASIIDICDQKGIRLDDGLLQVMKAGIRIGKSRRTDQHLIDVVSTLTKKVWSLQKLEKLVMLAAGCQMDSSTDSEYADIGPKALIEALGIIYETDISRFETMSPNELKSRVSPEVGGGMNQSKKVEVEKEPTKTAAPPADPNTTPESVVADLKRRGVKLNNHEKRILSTVVNPGILNLSVNIKVNLSDLILPSSTKLVLQTIVTLPLLRPEFFKKGVLSRSSIQGVLLFGPPGTGKTMLAKAIAKCSGAWFLNVSLSDIFEKYVGEGEKNVRAIFTLARKLGGPVVIFLDEVDAVFGTRRSDGSGSSRREVVNEFMAEWDGLSSKNDGIVVLGATNRPFDLDDAILRRMPRRILIDLPDEAARKQILQSHLKGETFDETVDLDELSKMTNQYSGSDLKNICVAAALARVKETIVKETGMAELSDDQLKKKIDEIEDWGAYLSSSKAQKDEKSVVDIRLSKAHLNVGLGETPPSLTDETQTLIELRKWDSQHGDGASRRKKKSTGYGFDVSKVELTQ